MIKGDINLPGQVPADGDLLPMGLHDDRPPRKPLDAGEAFADAQTETNTLRTELGILRQSPHLSLPRSACIGKSFLLFASCFFHPIEPDAYSD